MDVTKGPPGLGDEMVVDEDLLLEDLAFVVQTCGPKPFFANPILTPGSKYFPDRWVPNEAGVRILTRRLMQYAGLEELQVDVQLYTDEAVEMMRASNNEASYAGAAAWFRGIEDGKALFGFEVGNLGRPDTMIASLGHEVAHAFRTFHGVTVADPAYEEVLTDITSVYLGFGVFACNSSRSYEKKWETRGLVTVTRESTQRLGYIPPCAFAFLLACQVTARGISAREKKRYKKFLKPPHSQYFAEAARGLRRSRVELLSEFKVSTGNANTWAASTPSHADIAPVKEDEELGPPLITGVEDSGPTCPYCDSGIDYVVKVCPHCGQTLKQGCPWLFGLIIVATLVFMFKWKSPILFFVLIAEILGRFLMSKPWKKLSSSIED